MAPPSLVPASTGDLERELCSNGSWDRGVLFWVPLQKYHLRITSGHLDTERELHDAALPKTPWSEPQSDHAY